MPSWRRLNALGYRLYSRLEDWRTAPVRVAPSRVERGGAGSVARRRVVHLNWGRIGDTVLTTGALRHYRRAFPAHEIVCLGREETRWLVAPHVDRFVSLATDAPDLGSDFATALGDGSLDGCDLMTADVHLFYGGLARLGDFIEAFPATRKVLYEGYAPRAAIAPLRSFPAGARVVPSVVKPAEPHVLHDVAHFLRALVAETGASLAPVDFTPIVPVPEPEPILDRLGLATASYVACQMASNNPKKDWPLASWERLFAARRELRFVALGSADDRERVAQVAAPNLVNLCGRTTLPESAALIARARAFCGIDSGMAHVAANLGVPTVVIAQNSTLGWFFPYPAALGRTNLTTLHNRRSPECVGCFFACPREPLWEMALRGARCLRELPWEDVAQALDGAAAGLENAP